MADIEATLDIIDRMAWMRQACLDASPPGPYTGDDPWFELRDAMVAAFATLSPEARDLLSRVATLEERMVACVRKVAHDHSSR